MKLSIEVELGGDIKDMGVAQVGFLKSAPKAIKRAIKAVCWAFEPTISVHLVEDRPKKGKKSGTSSKSRAARHKGKKSTAK